MASKTLSKDQQNFLWIAIACVDFIKLPLKDILANEIKPADLYQKINSSLTNGKGFLGKEQRNICFIQPPGQPDYKDFDVTLLYTLIRNLCCTSLRPTQGWGKVPDSSHTGIGDDIERLRLMRNKFAHAKSTGIPDSEFQGLWNDLKLVIQRIEKFMNSVGCNVKYEQSLADIERSTFGFEDLQKYKNFLEAMLILLRQESMKDEPDISIKGAEKVLYGEKACFEADLKQKETSYWPISWQRVRGSVTNQIDISQEKYRDSTRTQLVIHSVCKEDQGEYQAVLARESNGNKRKVESNSIFLQVVGELPVFEIWKVTAGLESVTIHYKIKKNDPCVYDIKWKKNGEELDFKTQKYFGGGLSDSYLRITSPNEADKGIYLCTLTNAVGFTSKDVKFDIPDVRISTEPKIPFGIRTQIRSEVSSTLQPSKYEWQKSVDGYAFQCIDINKLKYHGTNVGSDYPSLVIKKPSFDDMLYYRLLVWNRIGDSVSNTVYLNVTGSPPNITCSHETRFQSRSVKLIANVYLYDECHAIQEVFWTVNDEKIDEQGLDRKFSQESIDFQCLTIHNVNRCDAGSYKLTATNAVGSTISDSIELNIPDVTFVNVDEKNDGTQWFTLTIKSIPEPFLVQWSKREKNSDTIQVINVNADEFKGSSCSFPHPVLVVKQREQLENFYFQIKIKNFIGTCTKIIRKSSTKLPGTMKSENVSSEEKNYRILNNVDNDDKITGIKFAILFDDLADHFPQEKFQKLKDLIQNSKKVKNIQSLNEAKSARDCFRILVSENIFTQLDVTFMQFFLRRTECKELENKCVEYAKGQKGQTLGFYEEQPEDGFTHVNFHVMGVLSNFDKKKRREIKETIAAMVGCKTDRVFIEGYGRSESFFAIISIEVIYVGKLVSLKDQDRDKFVRLDIDYFTVDFIKVIVILSQESQRVEYHEHNQKEEHKIMPPKQITSVQSAVLNETSRELLHRMVDEEPGETCLKSQLAQLRKHVQKTEQPTFFPLHQRTFVPSKVQIRTSRELMHRKADEDLSEACLKSQLVEYSERNQTKEEHRIMPPQQITSVQFAVLDNISHELLHRTCLKSQRAEFREHVQKTEQPTFSLKHGRTFVSSKVQDRTSHEVLYRRADEDLSEACLTLVYPDQVEYNAYLRSSIGVSMIGTEHISCLKPSRLWLSADKKIKEIDGNGHLLRELSVNSTHAGYHTLTKDGDLLFKKENDIYILSSSGEIRNLQIHATKLSCIHSSRLNGDIFVSQEGLIKRYNDRGVELQTITIVRITVERRLKCKPIYEKLICNIAENINGDIIVTNNVEGIVVAYTSDGKHKFNYLDLHKPSEFDPKGIHVCTDRFGHILVGDFCFIDPCVHLLDGNGHFLAKLLTYQPHERLECSALCVDYNNNLYVGYGNRINVYTYL